MKYVEETKGTVDIKRSEYSGIKLKSLIFLINSFAPINIENHKKAVYELFQRYFNEGRLFDIYEILNKDELMLYFYYSMQFELTKEDISIPKEHLENFSKCIIRFVELMERNDLQLISNNEELSGFCKLIESIRDSKIKDNLLKQKLNNLMKKVKENFKKDKSENKDNKNNEKEAKSENKSLELIEETKAISNLKKLEISVSKINKKDLLALVPHLELYDKDDRLKIMKKVLSKYPSELTSNLNSYYQMLAFSYNMLLKLPDINMWYIPYKSKMQIEKMAEILGFEDDFIGVYHYLKETFSNIKGFDRRNVNQLLRRLFGQGFIGNQNKATEKNKYQLSLIRFLINKEDIEYGRELVSKYKREPLSKLISDKVERMYFVYADVEFNEDKLEIFDSKLEGDEINILQYISEIYGNVEKESDRILFENFFVKIPIDRDILKYLSCDNIYSDKNFPIIKEILHLKHKKNKMSTEELILMYKDKECSKLLLTILNRTNFKFGFNSAEDYYNHYFREVIKLFNFSKEDELIQFFSLPFSAMKLFTHYTHGELPYIIVSKLEKELPSEYLIVKNYLYENFENKNNFVYQTKFYDNFSCSVKEGGLDRYFNLEQLRVKFIIDYFKETYGEYYHY